MAIGPRRGGEDGMVSQAAEKWPAASNRATLGVGAASPVRSSIGVRADTSAMRDGALGVAGNDTIVLYRLGGLELGRDGVTNKAMALITFKTYGSDRTKPGCSSGAPCPSEAAASGSTVGAVRRLAGRRAMEDKRRSPRWALARLSAGLLAGSTLRKAALRPA
jgi:hypothetical protein